MEHSNYHVVLIDDDKDFLNGISNNLQDEFKVKSFTDPHHALKFAEEFPVDAVVMDYHMPGKNAFELYMEFKMKKMGHPVLFLTGDADPSLRVDGLNLGVDDFLHKPITTAELSAFLKNRIKTYRKRSPHLVRIKNMQVNLSDTTVLIDGNEVVLTPKEYLILSMLVTKTNSIVRKSEIVQRLWPDVKVEENNVDTHLSNLRKKLSSFTGQIKTVKCMGYILRDI